MQRKEPTPSAKREITNDQARSFLSKYYPDGASNIQELSGGKHSKAFLYEYNNESFVIRFSTDNIGFLKDQYAFEHLGNIPIPEVIDMGRYEDDLHYCVTRKAPGETVRDQYKMQDFSSIALLYDTVEKIAEIKLSGTGYGYLDLNGNAPYASSVEYIQSVYRSKDLFDWEQIFQIPFVEKRFTDYVAERMEYFSQFTTKDRELLHGDFGADNILVQDGRVSGVIDWEKMRCGDHFLDVGRILLFCPNRQATTSAAVEFYKDKNTEHWKERVAMGVYHVVLTNYAYAAQGGNEESCKTSETRLKELEHGLHLI